MGLGHLGIFWRANLSHIRQSTLNCGSSLNPTGRATNHNSYCYQVETQAKNQKYSCRANMAHIRQSTPAFGLGLQVKVLKTFKLSPPQSLAAGGRRPHRLRALEAPRGYKPKRPRRSSHMLRALRPRTRFSPWTRTLNPESFQEYRGTSLIRNSTPRGPYSRPMPRALWWS